MRIVLAYSGGLDTSVALRWLQERYGAEVVAFCAGIGQPGSLEEVARRALAAGASEARVEDLRATYLQDYVFRALRANAAYEGQYLLAAPLGRPLIARRLVEIAREVGADAVAHGASGKGNDQVRFYSTVAALAPGLSVIAPLVEWELRSRADEVEYARRFGIEIPDSPGTPYSLDGSIWGTSTECGVLDDPGVAPPPDAFQLTVAPQEAPDAAAVVRIGFETGTPVSLDGEPLDAVTLVDRLTRLGGAHAVGRVDIVENSRLGLKTRAVYESPAGTLLLRAHREVEAMTLDRDTLHYKAGVEARYAELVYDGLWFSPLRRALDAFVEHTQLHVSGSIDLSLYRGNVTVAGRRVERSLYSPALAGHDGPDSFDHHAAEGFAYVWSLPHRTEAEAGAREPPLP